MKRRHFVKGAGALGLVSIVADPHGFLNFAFAQIPGAEKLQHLSYRAHRFTIDLDRTTVQRERLTDGTPADFPAVNPHERGRGPTEVFSISVGVSADDALAFNALNRFDVVSRKAQSVTAANYQMFGEPVYVYGRSQDWLLHLGYDDRRDETFLDIRRPKNLDLVTRAWLSRWIPLGFHGQYFGEG